MAELNLDLKWSWHWVMNTVIFFQVVPL